MTFDVSSLTDLMTEAASESVLCWPSIRKVAECELQRFAQILEDVRCLYADGVIEEDEASEIASAHRVAAQAALRAVQSIGVTTARAAAPRLIRAAVAAVQPEVNRTIGFRLI